VLAWDLGIFAMSKCRILPESRGFRIAYEVRFQSLHLSTCRDAFYARGTDRGLSSITRTGVS